MTGARAFSSKEIMVAVKSLSRTECRFSKQVGCLVMVVVEHGSVIGQLASVLASSQAWPTLAGLLDRAKISFSSFLSIFSKCEMK